MEQRTYNSLSSWSKDGNAKSLMLTDRRDSFIIEPSELLHGATPSIKSISDYKRDS